MTKNVYLLGQDSAKNVLSADSTPSARMLTLLYQRLSVRPSWIISHCRSGTRDRKEDL